VQQNREIAFIHLLRGIAPLFVIMAHLGGWWLMVNHQSSDAFDLWLDTVVKPFHLYQHGGHLGVVLFFLVSGFIISHAASNETRLEFFIKRAFRLLPTLAVGVALTAAATWIAASAGLNPILGDYAVTDTDYLRSAFLLDLLQDGGSRGLSVTWSLLVEVMFYTIVAIVIPMLRSRPLRSTWLMTAIVFALMVPHAVVPKAAAMMYFTVYLPILIVGRCFYLGYSKQATREQIWLLVAVNFVGFCLLYSSRFPYLFQAGTEPFATYLLAILIFCAAMMSGLPRVPEPFKFLGNVSYALYLVHIPIGMLILNAMVAMPVPFSLKFSIAAGASIAVAAAVTRLVDRPCQRIARSLRIHGGPAAQKLITALAEP
jgi:peptidoglycan/LPS O-acetylase OafA/YrhL